ncbi:MAG: HDIG domain-containing protein, partial [Ignavibacteria bacterium]|nr:HDIG domain-containing protein [Ignavibacteria bacterium]
MLKNRLHESLRVKFTLLFFTVIIIVLLLPRGVALESQVNVGAVWLQDDLIAEFSFPIYKNKETVQSEVDFAKKSIIPIFQSDEAVSRNSLDSLRKFSAFLEDLVSKKNTVQNPTFLSTQSFNMLVSGVKSERNAKDKIRLVAQLTQNILRTAYQKGIIDFSLLRHSRDTIALRTKNIDILIPVSKYIQTSDNSKFITESIERAKLPSDYHKVVTEYLHHFLWPNIVYSSQLTKEEEELAARKIPRIIGIVTENERIVGKHDRITNDIKQKIESYRLAKADHISLEALILQNIGKFLHIAALLYLFGIYIFLFRKKIFHDNLKLIVFAILLLWISIISYFVNTYSINEGIRFLIFIPAASMLITIMFDSRVGFYATVVFALIAGGLQGNDYPFVVMNLVAGALSVYTVRDIKNRTQIFRSFIFILIGYTVTILAFGLERFDPWQKMIVQLSFAATNALVSPVLTYGFLIFFERLFKITTDLALLELSNSNNPLLRELAKKAPGTFNHSMVIGTLAENAALAIGANALLARVGAYYHDIGKTLMPRAFVENQGEHGNIHDELTPEESIRALKEHVILGQELARKNNIPEEIIQFIPQHHGTTVMFFFYEKAKKMYGESKVLIADYRYPGPKPGTKEAAIVMLADTCESAVRSMDDPEPEKV